MSGPAQPCGLHRTGNIFLPPLQDSKATQTVGVLQKKGPRSPFKTVLSTNLTPSSRHHMQPQHQSQSMMTRTTTMRQLSYTSSPRPYLSGQINRSLSMGHALNSLNIAATPPSNAYPQEQQQQPLSVAPSPSYCSSNQVGFCVNFILDIGLLVQKNHPLQDLMSSSLHGPASMQAAQQHYSTPKTASHRTHRRTPSTAGPMSMMVSTPGTKRQ